MIEHYLRIYESEGTQIEPDGLSVEDPPSSLKETPLRVLNEGGQVDYHYLDCNVPADDKEGEFIETAKNDGTS